MERWCIEWGPGFRILAGGQATVEELWRFCALRDDALTALRITAGGHELAPDDAASLGTVADLTMPARRVMCDARRAVTVTPECREVLASYQSAEERAPTGSLGGLASIRRREGG